MFEQLVRPFQQPDALTRKRLIASSTKITVGTATGTIGKAGAAISPQEFVGTPPGGFQVIDCDHKFGEATRHTTPITVRNPADPNDPSFLIVGRLDAISFTTPKDDTLSFYTFNYVQPVVNISTTADWQDGSTTILNAGDVTGLVSGAQYVLTGIDVKQINGVVLHGGCYFTFDGSTGGSINLPAAGSATAGGIKISSITALTNLAGVAATPVIDQSQTCKSTYTFAQLEAGEPP